MLFKNLKMFTSVHSFKLDCYLDSLGIIDISEALSWMPDLHMLDLKVGNINTEVVIALSTALRSLNQLRVLVLTVNPIAWSHNTVAHNRISNNSVLALQEGLRHLTLLEDLRLDCRDRGERSNNCQCNKMLIGLFNLKHIRKLELFSMASCFEEEGANLFAELSKQMTKLEYLDISKNFISNRARVIIDRSIQALSTLKFLKISSNFYGDVPMITGGLKQLTQLQHLHLSHSIGKWIAALEGFKFLTQLVKLDLSYVKIMECQNLLIV